MTDWPHPTHDLDGMGGPYGGDVCPWCGRQLRLAEEAVHAETENEGKVLELAPEDVSKPLLHRECYQEYRGQDSHDLDEFREVGEA